MKKADAAYLHVLNGIMDITQKSPAKQMASRLLISDPGITRRENCLLAIALRNFTERSERAKTSSIIQDKSEPRKRSKTEL